MRAARSFLHVRRREEQWDLSLGIDDNLALFPGSAEHTINKEQEDVSLLVGCGAVCLPSVSDSSFLAVIRIPHTERGVL